MSENREVKSDVFSMLMEDKINALSVYNALNGSNYTDPEMVEYKTLEKGISLTVRNDAAFIVSMDLNIYEHQSTFSPNVPLRALIYLAEILKPYVKDRDIYGSKKVMIPTPKFAIIYNGRRDRPAEEVLKLSDLFENPTDNPQIELTCTAYNINPGKNTGLLEECSVINEYTIFIEKVREYESAEVDEPIKKAIECCIANHVLEEFLKERGSEVLKAMTIDMTFEHREEIIRKEERAEGRVEGVVSTVKSMGGNKMKAVEIIVKELDITEIEAKELVDRYWGI